ncbi:hypothetical protein [Legionella maioricensis]|uniref:Uncharacterized protein n=1 Tax=Legionella maioricensis TaxID=2896528 RepID=A0A9X2CZ12_9GAMM|nr:hypothetical protein [Legionella maioricensis]MCL9683070.1 hypothetical protein [Legionella maioricensis]MCL9686418.1 hypothetical protein [Legionella maioricensis]
MTRTGGHTGFFTRTPANQSSTQTATELSFINVGGEQFHALAVALIDSIRNASRVNETTLKILLDRFFDYYPKFKAQLPYLTPAERMGMLINGPRKSEKVECMAFVLRQLVIDEIYAHPLDYREVFDGLDVTTSKGFLRESTTVLPPSVLGALARTLGITITLSITEHGKEIRKRDVFTDSTVHNPKLELVLQVQGEHYFPGVANKADFAYVGQLAISPPEPVVDSHENTGTIAPIVALIEADNKRLLQSFLQWRENFLTMIKGNELTTSSLMDFYIKFLPTVRGIIADTTAFFSKLTQAAETPVTLESFNGPNKQINELLASSLAGWISTNKIEVDQLFERIEAESSQSASPAA